MSHLNIIPLNSAETSVPSRKAVRADDKRLAVPGQKQKTVDKHGNPPRTRFELYEAGLIHVADMTDREIEKGRWADKEGKFKGRPPARIPRKFYDELQAERIKRWNRKVETDLDAMRDVLRDIALNPRASADARHKSAVYLIERTVGKVPEKSEIKVDLAKWEENIEGVLVDDGADQEEANDEGSGS